MRKLMFLVIVIIVPLFFIGAVKLPFPSPGVYTGKLINISNEDFFKEDYLIQRVNAATLTDIKPEGLTVDPLIDLKKPLYGSFLLGDNDKQVHFTMVQDKQGYWTEFYIDQDLDYIITPLEKLKDLKTWEPARTKDGYDVAIAAITNAPFQLTTSYKGSAGEIKKKLSFYIWAKNYSKRGKEDENYINIETVSAFEGFLKVMMDKEEKMVKYRIADANCNGCFNDYGKDYIYLDTNFDGFYKKNEAVPLYEFFDLKVDRKSTQMRLIVPSYPAKIGVSPAIENFDETQLEP